MPMTVTLEERKRKLIRFFRHHSPADVSTVAQYLRCSETRALYILKILVKEKILTTRQETVEEALYRFRSRPRIPRTRIQFRKRLLYLMHDHKWHPTKADLSEQLSLPLSED